MATADPRTFDLFAPEEAVTYPDDVVRVYRDRKSLYDLKQLESQIANTLDPKAVEVLDEKAAALRVKIDSSALLVAMQGIPTSKVNDIRDSVPVAEVPKPDLTGASEETSDKLTAEWADRVRAAEDENTAAVNAKLMESMIVSITKPDGAVAGHPGERTKEWFDSLPPEARKDLLRAMADLSFSALEYEAETESADF